MKIENIELRRVSLPLVSPFRTSFGSVSEREAILVHVSTADAEGWAECAAEPDPLYSSEFLDGCELVIRDHLVPRLAAAGPDQSSSCVTAERVAPLLAAVKGHRMSKVAFETAILDAQLRRDGVSFGGGYLGAVNDRVPTGVSVGIMDSIDRLLAAVEGYFDEGYLRIKLKIEPGWDLAPCVPCVSASGKRCCCRSRRTPRTCSRTPVTSLASTPSTCS